MSRPYEPEVLDKLHKVQLQILEDFDKVCKKHNLKYFVLYGTAIGAVRHEGFIPWDDDIDVGMLREDYTKFLNIAEEDMGEEYQIMTPLKDRNYACTVTHLQRKNTRFIPHVSKKMKCDLCIDLDIFPLDYVAPTKKLRKRQKFLTTFWGRLLFLVGTPFPDIPLKGIKGRLSEIICFITHYVLKILRISAPTIYKLFQKESQRYNPLKTKYVTSFEYSGSIKDMIEAEKLFPVTEVPFEDITVPIPANNDLFLRKVYGDYMKIPPKEQRINHCPYLIQFEGEKEIINE